MSKYFSVLLLFAVQVHSQQQHHNTQEPANQIKKWFICFGGFLLACLQIGYYVHSQTVNNNISTSLFETNRNQTEETGSETKNVNIAQSGRSPSIDQSDNVHPQIKPDIFKESQLADTPRSKKRRKNRNNKGNENQSTEKDLLDQQQV